MSVARLVLRLAAREVTGEARRSGLIAALIAIPVAGLAAGIVFLQSPSAPIIADRGVTAGGESGVVVLILAFVGALVCLLTGSAFLVAAKAQQRSVAVIASLGTSRAVLVAISSLTGPLIGGVGGGAGVLLGAGLGFVLVTMSGAVSVYVSGPLMLALVVFAVVLGWIAALPPAIAASRADVVLAIQGSTLPAPRPRHLLLGVSCLVTGIALAFGPRILDVVARRSEAGSFPWLSALVAPAPFFAASMMLAGAIITTPFLLTRWARGARAWGLAAQLAARDADRNRSRHLPVIAAIMGTTFLAVFVMCSQSSSGITSRMTYPYMMMPGGVQTALISYPGDQGTTLGPTIDPGTDREALAESVAAVFTAGLPIDRLSIIETPPILATTENTTKPASPVVTPKANRCVSNLPGNDRFTPLAPDPLCRDWYTEGAYSGAIPAPLIIGDALTLATILDAEPSPAAQAALANGEAVSLHPQFVDTTSTVELNVNPAASGESTTVRIKAVVEKVAEVLPFGVIITHETASRLGLQTEFSQVVATTTREPTEPELAAIDRKLADLAGTRGLFVYLETGPTTDPAIGWLALALSESIVLAASMVALTLSRTEGKRDALTLHAVGSSTKTLRATAAWQGLTVVATGTWAGAVIGLLTAFSMNLPGSGSVFSAPWTELIALAVATPLFMAACGWLVSPVTRSSHR